MTDEPDAWLALPSSDQDQLSTAFLLAANAVMMADQKVDREEIDAMLGGLNSISRSNESTVARGAARSLIDGFARIAIRGDAEDIDSYPARLATAKDVVDRLAPEDRTYFGIAVKDLCHVIGNATGSEVDGMMSPEETAMANTVMRALGFDPGAVAGQDHPQP